MFIICSYFCALMMIIIFITYPQRKRNNLTCNKWMLECVWDDISSIINAILLVAVPLLNPNGSFSCNKRDCLCALGLLGDWYAAQQVWRYYLNYASIHESLCPTGCVLRWAFKSPLRHAVSMTLLLHKHTYVSRYSLGCAWKQGMLLFSIQAILILH